MSRTLSNSLLAQSDSETKVLVDRDKLEAVSDHINGGLQHDMPWELLLVGIGAMLMTVVVVSVRRWWLSRHADPSPMVLFIAIARKAGLGWRDRYLLWRISRTFDLPTPIALMLARGTLRHYRALYLSNRAGCTHHRASQRLARIEMALFG
ncbi:MAG: hypothetical protein AB8C95_14715 [Phycisphaeraceae bacterium]